ncbi:uncharacterized protein LOC143022658 [Oratosquilla oratoria]|uniref:uncharacterized protein LOC143022658 n=1 Tax=Oratosquilla oratoria TaxID=337810 RepID=UPI003F75B380
MRSHCEREKNKCSLMFSRNVLEQPEAMKWNSCSRRQESIQSFDAPCKMEEPIAEKLQVCSTLVIAYLVLEMSDFTAQLSQIHERHAEDLQHLVETYRKRNSELRNERPCQNQMFQAWETLLQEAEVDSQIHSDVAGTLARQVSRPLIEKTFNRKIQSRKIFIHRESFDSILSKTEEKLKKCKREYVEAYQEHCKTQSNASLAAYFDAHNAYVQQLHATNGMLQEYNNQALPAMLEVR